MRQSQQKAYCKGCLAHWTHGVADGKYNNWCCRFGKPAKDIFNHCGNKNARLDPE